MDTVKERLLHFLKTERISKAEFARRMNVSETYVSTMRKSLPEVRVTQLMEIFPNLNRDWLLYGEGEMYKDADRREKVRNARRNFVPLLPVEAYAGSLQAYSESVDPADCTMIPMEVKGADFGIRISGDSMEPVIHNGVIAIVAKIDERAFIPWGNPMVVDTENGAFVKVLKPSELGSDYIEASSYNPAYPPFQIPCDSIHNIYRIICYYQPVHTM